MLSTLARNGIKAGEAGDDIGVALTLELNSWELQKASVIAQGNTSGLSDQEKEALSAVKLIAIGRNLD